MRTSNSRRVIRVGKKAWEDVIFVNENEILGKRIIKTVGKVEVRHDGALSFNKQAKWYFNAPNKLKKSAYKLGANAVIGAQNTIVNQGKTNVYYGTAVIVEDKE